MIRISRMLHTVLPLVLLLSAMPASSQTDLQRPINESTSSGLFTFSSDERAIRVAAVFAAKDSAVVPTLVRFLDQGGNVLKQVLGDLSEDNAVIAELRREDVAGRGDLLVRVEVFHQLPGLRREIYPIIVTTQSFGPAGGGSFYPPWNGGTCGNPPTPGTVPSQPVRHGTHVMCKLPTFVPL